MFTEKNAQWVPYAESLPQPTGGGVTRRGRDHHRGRDHIFPGLQELPVYHHGAGEVLSASEDGFGPAHTHERRVAVCMYFEVPEGEVVFHRMGQGDAPRCLGSRSNGDGAESGRALQSTEF